LIDDLDAKGTLKVLWDPAKSYAGKFLTA